jgi:hypothetical protein
MQQTAEIHELRRARKRTPIPIPDGACRVIGALGMDGPASNYGVTFQLRTRRQGTEIWFYAPRTAHGHFSWNVSALNNIWPKSFAAAREWVAAYAAGFGQTVEEIRKEQMKRPSGEDRKALKAGGCREAWLTSEIPTLWAEAMVRCQHPGAYCGEDGYCHYGDCDMEMLPEADGANGQSVEEKSNGNP